MHFCSYCIKSAWLKSVKNNWLSFKIKKSKNRLGSLVSCLQYLRILGTVLSMQYALCINLTICCLQYLYSLESDLSMRYFFLQNLRSIDVTQKNWALYFCILEILLLLPSLDSTIPKQSKRVNMQSRFFCICLHFFKK